MNEVKVEEKAIILKKEWVAPEITLWGSKIIEHLADTLSDGTGNLLSGNNS